MPGTPSPAMPVDQPQPRARGSSLGGEGADWRWHLNRLSSPGSHRGARAGREARGGPLRPRVHSCASGSQPDGKFGFSGGWTTAGPPYGPPYAGSKPRLSVLLWHSANSSVCSQTGLEMTRGACWPGSPPFVRGRGGGGRAGSCPSNLRTGEATVWVCVCGVPRATSPPYQDSACTDPVSGRRPSRGTF